MKSVKFLSRILVGLSVLLPTTVLAQQFIQTANDKIPNFGANPTITSTRTGNWSDPGAWSLNRVPGSNDVVSILNSHTITFDSIIDPPSISGVASIKTVAIQSGGVLRFRTDISTKLTTVNLLVMQGGELEIGTVLSPVPIGKKAEIIITNLALDTANDPQQFGNGIIVLGKVRMHGAAKLPFTRLAAEPHAGDHSLSTAESVNSWQSNDLIVLPDSKFYPMETVAGPFGTKYEQLSVASIANPNLINITAANGLAFDHPGVRDGDNVLRYLPHVANLTRTIVIKSESAGGTRGHFMATARADIDIRYAQFSGLGRTTNLGLDNTTLNPNGTVAHLGTNQGGRYPVNFRHLMGPTPANSSGAQFTFLGNSVFCPMGSHNFRWGITLENAHYGLVKDNVMYNWAGSGFATANGSESFNIIEHNIAILNRGRGGRDGDGEPGNEGAGFWFRGPNNYVRNNVAATSTETGVEAAYGYKLFYVYLGNIRIPTAAGSDTAVSGQYIAKDGSAMAVLEFAGNETYGNPQGLSLWWVNALDTAPQNQNGAPKISVIKDFVCWNIYRYGFYGYPMADVHFDGLKMINEKSYLYNWHEFAMGMWFGDYMTKNSVIKNFEIQGFRTGIADPYFGGAGNDANTVTRLENGYMRNTVNISVNTIGAPGSGPNGASRSPKSMIVKDVSYGSTAGWNHGGRTPANISMNFQNHNGSANYIKSDTVFVYNYDKQANDNFQLFYPEQAPNFIVPQSSGNIAGSPVAGETNAQNWANRGIAIAGAVAPCSNTRALVNGFTCAINTGNPPPGSSNNPPVIGAIADRTITLGAQISFTANATDPDGDSVTFSLINPPSGAQINSLNGNFSWTPSAVGSYTLSVKATDSLGANSTKSFVVTVSSNTPPPTNPPLPPPPTPGIDGTPVFPSTSPTAQPSNGIGSFKPFDINKDGQSDLVTLTRTSNGARAVIRLSESGPGVGAVHSFNLSGSYFGLASLGANKASGVMAVRAKKGKYSWYIYKGTFKKNRRTKFSASSLGSSIGVVGVDQPIVGCNLGKAVPALYRDGVLSLYASKRKITRVNVAGYPSCISVDTERNSLIGYVTSTGVLTIVDVNGNVRFAASATGSESLQGLEVTALIAPRMESPGLVALGDSAGAGGSTRLFILSAHSSLMHEVQISSSNLGAFHGVFGNYRWLGLAGINGQGLLDSLIVLPESGISGLDGD